MDGKFNLSIRAKVIAIIVLSAVLIDVVVFEILRPMLLNNYQEIEITQTEENLQRVNDTFENELSGMLVKLRDWAIWDDSYAFVKNPTSAKSAEFLKVNLADNTLINLEINVMMFVNQDGKVVFSKAVDLTDNTEIPSENIATHIIAHSDILMPANATSKAEKKAIMLLPEGSALVASKPIFGTDEIGANGGTLIFASFVDQKKVDKVSRITHIPIEYFPVNSKTIPPEVAKLQPEFTQKENYIIDTTSAEHITGYSVMRDIDGNVAFIYSILEPRTIYSQGKALLNGVLIGLIVLSICFGLFIIWMLEHYVVSRMTKLSDKVLEIGHTQDLSTRMPNEYHDEVGTLTDAINKMLSDLQAAHERAEEMSAREKEATQKLQERLNEIEHMNQLMIGRELKMAELKQTIKKIQDTPPTQ